ncbi:hypothetical protein [Nannocystis pusilla]|uniref:hypothetical protein n=1 Tax=Nannocystis pusilla TaxID=889268 RepID=UPI003B821AD0
MRPPPWGAPIYAGTIAGNRVRVAAYTEPSLFWERTHGLARSWNVMADHTCLVSLEDRASAITLDEAAAWILKSSSPGAATCASPTFFGPARRGSPPPSPIFVRRSNAPIRRAPCIAATSRAPGASCAASRTLRPAAP